MNTIDTKELERIISLYLDGELKSDTKKSFELFLAEHPVVARDVEVLRKVKTALSTKQRIPKNEWFLLKLSNKLESQEIRKGQYSVFSRPIVGIVSVAAVIFVFIGAVFFKDASFIKHYFLEKKNLIDTTIMTGSILPFFNNLNKDDVLNFALQGTLSLDSAKRTALTVKKNDKEEAQFEITREGTRHAVSPITVKEFLDNVGITRLDQQIIIDSILTTFGRKLQSSVLVSENKEIAIHEQLVDLNRAMVSTISESLEPAQRLRFRKFMKQNQSPSSLVSLIESNGKTKIPSDRFTNSMVNNRYVVISKDSVGIEEMELKSGYFLDMVDDETFSIQKAMTEKMLHEIVSSRRQVVQNTVFPGSNDSRVKVYSTENVFQINLHTRGMNSDYYDPADLAQSRVSSNPSQSINLNAMSVNGDSALSFELFAGDEAMRIFRRLPKGEFKFEIIDSTVKEPKVKIMFRTAPIHKEFESKLREMSGRGEDLIDLDSLLIESKKLKEKSVQPNDNKNILDL